MKWEATLDFQSIAKIIFNHVKITRKLTFDTNYLQGKEFEIKLKEKKPGDLSDDLRTALGMPIGPVSL